MPSKVLCSTEWDLECRRVSSKLIRGRTLLGLPTWRFPTALLASSLPDTAPCTNTEQLQRHNPTGTAPQRRQRPLQRQPACAKGVSPPRSQPTSPFISCDKRTADTRDSCGSGEDLRPANGKRSERPAVGTATAAHAGHAGMHPAQAVTADDTGADPLQVDPGRL